MHHAGAEGTWRDATLARSLVVARLGGWTSPQPGRGLSRHVPHRLSIVLIARACPRHAPRKPHSQVPGWVAQGVHAVFLARPGCHGMDGRSSGTSDYMHEGGSRVPSPVAAWATTQIFRRWSASRLPVQRRGHLRRGSRRPQVESRRLPPMRAVAGLRVQGQSHAACPQEKPGPSWLGRRRCQRQSR